MTLPVTAEPLPTSYTFGKVVGRVIHLIADTAADTDDKPQARAAVGRVVFSPKEVMRKTTEASYPAIVLHSAESAALSASGALVDAENKNGIWLAVGTYAVSFEINGGSRIPSFDIQVTSAHTDAAPLDLATVVPYVPPTGTVVQTLVVPAGGTDGQVLARTSGGGLVWADQTGGGGGGSTTDASLLTSGILPAARIGDGSITAAKVAADVATQAELDELLTAARSRANHTGTQSLDTTTDSATRLAMTATERTKLGGVATGATANATDAALRDRSTHTGTQAASTITGLATVATSGAYNDLSGKPTIPAADGATQATTNNYTASGSFFPADNWLDTVRSYHLTGNVVISGLPNYPSSRAGTMTLIFRQNPTTPFTATLPTATVNNTPIEYPNDAAPPAMSTTPNSELAVHYVWQPEIGWRMAWHRRYNDTSEAPSGGSYTDEQAQDAAAALLTGGTHTGISFTYDDAGNKVNAVVSGGGGGGGTDLGYIDATKAPYNADKTGATDATAAIQAAITAVVAQGGGTVLLPRGTYLLSGAQQTGTVAQAKNYTYSGQILFPARDMTQGYMTVRVMGETPVDSVFWGPQTGDAMPVEVGGTILKTTATSGNVFDCIPPTNIGALSSDPDMPGFTNMTVSFENFVLRAPNNPQCGGINLSRAIGASIRNVTVGVDATTASVAQPTGTRPGIQLPLSYNGAHVEVDGSQVYGYPVGLTHAEHARLQGFSVYACAIGIRPSIAYHLSSYERVLLQRNIRHLVAGSGDSNNPILIEGTIAFESGSTGWYATTYDVDDINNAFKGALRFTRWNDPTIVVRGASGLRLTNLRTALPQVTSSNLTKIEQMTQAAYDALGTKDAATLYVIVG